MIYSPLPSIFTIEIGGKPTLTFQAKNLREAQQLCHEAWLKDDLTGETSGGVPLWDGNAKLRVRIALESEAIAFAEAEKATKPSGGLLIVYLVDIDVS
ncbi:hypothetical protein V1282_005391 [Nitrobacteraceae bacterium AZCC 2146]